MPAQGIDDAVDGLERDRFALVSSPPQDDRAPLLREVVDEALHERRLAHARRSADVDGDAAAAASCVECAAERREVPFAPDERDVCTRGGPERGRGGTWPPEPRHDVCTER